MNWKDLGRTTGPTPAELARFERRLPPAVAAVTRPLPAERARLDARMATRDARRAAPAGRAWVGAALLVAALAGLAVLPRSPAPVEVTVETPTQQVSLAGWTATGGDVVVVGERRVKILRGPVTWTGEGPLVLEVGGEELTVEGGSFSVWEGVGGWTVRVDGGVVHVGRVAVHPGSAWTLAATPPEAPPPDAGPALDDLAAAATQGLVPAELQASKASPLPRARAGIAAAPRARRAAESVVKEATPADVAAPPEGSPPSPAVDPSFTAAGPTFAALLSRRDDGGDADALLHDVRGFLAAWPRHPLAEEARVLELELTAEARPPAVAWAAIERWAASRAGDPRYAELRLLQVSLAVHRLRDCARAAEAGAEVRRFGGPAEVAAVEELLRACRG